MDLTTWLSIIGVLTTLAVGLPVYWLKQGDRSHQTATSGGVAVTQQVHISQRHSQQTHNHYTSGSSRTGDDDLWGYVALMIVATLAYWAWRPYLLLALGALVMCCAVLTWAGERCARPAGNRGERLRLLLAFSLIGANCVLLVYPGLVWGDGFRLDWTFAQGAHLHGLGFAGGAIPLVLATVLSLLLVATRCLAVLATLLADRSRHAWRADGWRRIAQYVGPIGFSRGVLWTAPVLALIGLVWVLVVPAIGPSTLGSVPPPVHPLPAVR
jgi:hypothetical protein